MERFIPAGLKISFIIGVVCIFLPIQAFADDNSLQVQEFIELLLRTSHSKVHIIPEELPPSLPLNLDLPEKSRVVGSIVSFQEEGQTISQSIVLEVDGDLKEVSDYFYHLLTEQGWVWHDGSYSFRRYPFLDIESGIFCQTVDSLPIVIYFTISEKDSALRVFIRINLNQPCKVWTSDPFFPTPQLNPPEYVRIIQQGAHSSDNSNGKTYRLNALAEGPVKAFTINKHYIKLLQDGGWVLQEEENTDYLAWSKWRLSDNEMAMLFISPGIKDDQYILRLEIVSTTY